MDSRFMFRARAKNAAMSCNIKDGEWVFGMPIFGNLDNNFTEIQTLKTQDGVDDCGEPWYKSDDELVAIDRDTIGQCIGIKDRKGNHAYDGDIIIIGVGGACCGTKAVIIYDKSECGYFLKTEHDDWYSMAGFGMGSEFEIIGNIYDNKVSGINA